MFRPQYVLQCVQSYVHLDVSLPNENHELMKTITIALIALCCSQGAGAETNWVDVIDKAAVRIETVLYEKKDHPNFFIHVEVRNQSPHEIGIDLSDKWMVLYPNQAVRIWTTARLLMKELWSQRSWTHN